MAYAANGQISQSPIEGGVEISEAEYVAARDSMLAGQEVVVENGAMVVREPAPTPEHAWENGEWIAPDPEPSPTPTIADVKAEAHRRIIAIMPEHDQRNHLALFAETTLEHGLDPNNWPSQKRQTNSAAMTKWQQIKAIRTASDRIEAMDPIPNDFTDDNYWP